MKNQDRAQFFIGTYSQPILHGTGNTLVGRGKGIYMLEFDKVRGQFTDCRLVAEAENPSFLCLSHNRRFLYAVNELKEYEGREEGSVSAYAIMGQGGLRLLNRKRTGGTDPCHVAISQDDATLVVSNFMSGSICVYPIAGDGSLGDEGQFVQHYGSSAHPLRQNGPHAHAATFDFENRYVYVPDLGTDEIKVYEHAAKGFLKEAGTYSSAPGCGPRYCEIHPTNGMIYCINEIDCTVSVLKPEGAKLHPYDAAPTLPPEKAKDTICAALHIAPSGRFLYASNRGADSLSAFTVRPDGTMRYIGNTPSGGRVPRDFIIDQSGRYLVVSNQDSDNIVIFSIDNDGRLGEICSHNIPTPVCVCQYV